MHNFSLSFIFLSIVSIIFFFLFSFTNYKVRFKSNYNIRNHFPYELNYEGEFKDNLLGNIFAILIAVGAILFYAFYDESRTNGYFLFTMIGGMINSLTVLALIFLPLKLLKAHLATVTINVIFSFLIPFALALEASIAFSKTKEAAPLIFIIINSLICLFVFILLLNPRLTRWADMDKKENEDGSISYLRPKYLSLAFTEWLLFFLNILLMVVAFLTRTFIN